MPLAFVAATGVGCDDGRSNHSGENESAPVTDNRPDKREVREMAVDCMARDEEIRRHGISPEERIRIFRICIDRILDECGLEPIKDNHDLCLAGEGASYAGKFAAGGFDLCSRRDEPVVACTDDYAFDPMAQVSSPPGSDACGEYQAETPDDPSLSTILRATCRNVYEGF